MITEPKSRRLAHYAFEYALVNGRKKARSPPPSQTLSLPGPPATQTQPPCGTLRPRSERPDAFFPATPAPPVRASR